MKINDLLDWVLLFSGVVLFIKAMYTRDMYFFALLSAGIPLMLFTKYVCRDKGDSHGKRRF